MSQLLNSITPFCGTRNIPGITKLEYLPIDWLDDGDYEEVIYQGNFQKAINPTLGGQSWLTLPFFAGATWTEAADSSAFGNVFTQEISGVIPKMTAAQQSELEKMGRHRFILRITDRNGLVWLVGRKEEPLQFFANSNAGSISGAGNGHQFRFTGATSRPAVTYFPVF